MGRRGKVVLQAAAVGVVASLIGLLAWSLATDARAQRLADEVRAGEKPAAPSLDLPELDGDGRLSLASLRGRAVILNFWASWCDPCKEEGPMLQAAWEQNRDRGLVVVGVNARDFKSDARRFVERYGMTFPIVHDARGSSLGRYGLQGFPETWWVDRQGRLVAYAQGQFTERELERNTARALGAA